MMASGSLDFFSSLQNFLTSFLHARAVSSHFLINFAQKYECVNIAVGSKCVAKAVDRTDDVLERTQWDVFVDVGGTILGEVAHFHMALCSDGSPCITWWHSAKKVES